jgi:hypothetical protein
MPEIIRNRDVIAHFRGDSYPVALDATMLAAGWAGGQGVRWTDSQQDEFMVTFSDGIYGGFLLWGSDEDADQYLGMTHQQLDYGYGIFCGGGWLLSTRTYEHYTYASRLAPPLVPITYQVGQRLVFSNRGLWTNEDEWTLSGDPRAPNTFYTASVVQVPRATNSYYLVLETSI